MLKKQAALLKSLSLAAPDDATLWLFLVLAIGLFARVYFLSQPMRGDEAYTFLMYVNGGLRSLFDYSAPNNHVLNTLLIKFFTTLFGASPASIRFPALVAGLAAIVFAFYFSRSLQKNRNSGIFAALTVAIFPYLILYSTNARGYSLIVALSLLIAWIALRYSNRPSMLDVVFLALFSALGMFAIPTMILPIAGIFLWLLVLLLLKQTPLKAIARQFVIPFGTLTGILTTLFYLPVVIASNGWAPIISNKFVKPQTWDSFLAEIIPQLEKSFNELSRDIPLTVLLLILILALFGMISTLATRNWALLLMLPCLLLGAAFILLVQHTNPYARTWIYFIPFILLLADAGLAFLLKKLSDRLRPSVNLILIMVGLFFAVNLTASDTITAYADTSAFPEAVIAAKYLKPIFKPGDTLRISPTADMSVYFYFWYDGMSHLLYDQAPQTGRVFFIRKKSRGPLGEAALQKYILLLDMGNMAIYQGKK